MHRNLMENNTRRILLYVCFVLVLLAVAGCSSEAPSTVVVAEEHVQTDQATLSPTAAPTATEQEAATEVVNETEEPQPEDEEDAASTEEISACVTCHTDQAMLIDTADPVEEVESENEGAG